MDQQKNKYKQHTIQEYFWESTHLLLMTSIQIFVVHLIKLSKNIQNYNKNLIFNSYFLLFSSRIFPLHVL
jgi:hypothetical protein